MNPALNFHETYKNNIENATRFTPINDTDVPTTVEFQVMINDL